MQILDSENVNMEKLVNEAKCLFRIETAEKTTSGQRWGVQFFLVENIS